MANEQFALDPMAFQHDRDYPVRWLGIHRREAKWKLYMTHMRRSAQLAGLEWKVRNALAIHYAHKYPESMFDWLLDGWRVPRVEGNAHEKAAGVVTNLWGFVTEIWCDRGYGAIEIESLISRPEEVDVPGRFYILVERYQSGEGRVWVDMQNCLEAKAILEDEERAEEAEKMQLLWEAD